MVRSGLLAAVAAAALVLGAGQASASQLVTNGDFSAGLTGWTVYKVNTTYSVFDMTPTVTTFETVAGVPSAAAEFSVGTNHKSQPDEGGGLAAQSALTTGASHSVWVNFSGDFAAKSIDADPSGGVVSLILDGTTLASFDFGAMGSNQIDRASLSKTMLVTAGAHVFDVQVTRAHSTTNYTPVDFFDNVSALTVSGVPEPRTWAMILSGLFMLGAALRSRKLFGQAI